MKHLIHRPNRLQARIVSGSVVLLSGSGLATAINFAYNVGVARFLGPNGFGHATAVYTLLTLLSGITLSFQITSAKIVAQQNSPEAKSAGYRGFHLAAWAFGILAALVLLLWRRPVSDYLNLPSPSLIALITIGIAFYIPLGTRRGYLQGAYGFRGLATSLVTEGAVRLGGSIILILLGYGVSGVIAANSAAVAVAYFAIRPTLAPRAPSPVGFANATRELLQAVVFFSGQVLLNNGDIVLVKHFFLPRSAGLYAVVAMVGRVIFSLSQSVVNSMFPLVAGSRDEDRRDFSVIATALSLVLAIGCGLAVVLRLTPEPVWTTFFGAKFEMTGPYGLSYLLALYAIVTVIYALSAVIITFEMSYKISNTSWIQLAFSGLEIGGICLFHSSLRQVILVQFLLMIGLLIFVALPFLINSLTGSDATKHSGEFGPVRLVRQVSEDEVISEFLRSDFYRPAFREYQQSHRELVMSPDLQDARENARRRALFFHRHLSLWNELPQGTQWYEAKVKESDLDQIRVFPRAQWRKIGRGNFWIKGIVERFRASQDALDSGFVAKILAIRDQLLLDSTVLGPVILIGDSETGPLTILDGNHRLVASMLDSGGRVEALRFLCGLSPKMRECCWHNTNFATLLRYARNVAKSTLFGPSVENARLLQEIAPLEPEFVPEDMRLSQEQEERDVMIVKRRVMVIRVPEQAAGRQGRIFLREFQGSIDADRPRVVLDCADLKGMNKSVVHILFCCLEEAMKRNGDAKLASLPAGAEEVLKIAGADRIFEIYETADEAAESFHQLQKDAASQIVMATPADLEPESAA